MTAILEWIFECFGKHPISRLVGCMVIGAVLVSPGTFAEPDVGSFKGWAIAGAGIGLAAGLVLNWPRAIPALVLITIGGAMVVIPAQRVDGGTIEPSFHAVKIAVGLIMLLGGAALLRSARQRRSGQTSQNVEGMPNIRLDHHD